MLASNNLYIKNILTWPNAAVFISCQIGPVRLEKIYGALTLQRNIFPDFFKQKPMVDSVIFHVFKIPDILCAVSVFTNLLY